MLKNYVWHISPKVNTIKVPSSNGLDNKAQHDRDKQGQKY